MTSTSLIAGISTFLFVASSMAGLRDHKDVKELLENIDGCEHLAGEFNSDLSKKEIREFVEHSNRECAKANYGRNTIRKKYKSNAEILKITASETLDLFSPNLKGSDVNYKCATKNSNFSIGDPHRPEEDSVNQSLASGTLTKYGPKTGKWGEPIRMGSGTVVRSCGKITIIFKGGYLNSNLYGPSGSLDFPVVEIRAGRRLLLARTAISSCEITNPRNSYFGACPARWASSVEAREVSPNKFLIRVKRSFSDTKDVDRQTDASWTK
jgi:hypothetical protein